MNDPKLLKMLDMDTPADLEYFEQLAELLEMDEDVDLDDLCELVSEADAQTLQELVHNYFEELTGNLPDDAQDVFSTADAIGQRLTMLAGSEAGDGAARQRFGEELYSFRSWLTSPEGAFVDGRPCSVLDAVTSCRMERFGGETHSYDFSPSLDYRLDELSIDLGTYSRVDVVRTPDDDEEEQ